MNAPHRPPPPPCPGPRPAAWPSLADPGAARPPLVPVGQPRSRVPGALLVSIGLVGMLAGLIVLDLWNGGWPPALAPVLHAVDVLRRGAVLILTR